MQLLAPAPYASISTRNGTYTADQNGLIYGVSSSPNYALADLINAGCIPLAFSPFANFRNLVDGGDFSTNAWQRGTSFTGISSTPTYTADRFFAAGGASSSISVSQQANAAQSGFSTALQFGRANANTNTSTIWLGQILESADSYRCQGQYVTFSFWAQAGANFSAVGANLQVSVQYGTGANQSSSSLMTGAWTGQAYPALTPSSSNGVAGVAGAYGVGSVAQQPITNSLIRYSFTCLIPTTATQIALLVGYTPYGAAGANDWVQFVGFQFEIESQPSVFEHRDIQVELEIAQRYCWVQNEPAAGVAVSAGMNTTTSQQLIFISLPVQMIKAPTVTFAGAPSWKTNQAGAATATTLTAGSTHTVNQITLNGNSAGVAGQGTMLQGGGGSGQIVVSADF